MSILSQLGEFIGQKHSLLLQYIRWNTDRIQVLEETVSDLQLQINQLQITGSVHTNDISVYGAEKGVILQAEDYTRYRLRVTSDKKLIIDDVTNSVTNINEIQLTPVTGSAGDGSSSENDQIGEMTIGDDFEIA